MKENWLALYASIISKNSAEKTLGLLGIKPKKIEKRNKKICLSEKEINKLEELKTDHTWNELGEIYRVDGEYLRVRVKATKKKYAEKNILIANINNSISL
ncbi:hypothetical protein [Clostridium botulinum]|uniref:hypothetical protein n=1 Tax=Clostridium botulinum TaxID=1491 RepID=UPI0019679A00|nr:hypothetical protein [Clostridium botulinum]MBN1050295.1 hypothetical protein [Clostridium botulinum]